MLVRAVALVQCKVVTSVTPVSHAAAKLAYATHAVVTCANIKRVHLRCVNAGNMSDYDPSGKGPIKNR